jgi:hypothetical protein
MDMNLSRPLARCAVNSHDSQRRFSIDARPTSEVAKWKYLADATGLKLE